MRRMTAEAEADALRKLASVRIQEAQEASEGGDLYVQLKSLELETQRMEAMGREVSHIHDSIGFELRSAPADAEFAQRIVSQDEHEVSGGRRRGG